MSALFFIFRRLAAWGLLVVLALIVWGTTMDEPPPWPFGIATLAIFLTVLVKSVSHVNRVRLVANRTDGEALANRHRRQIEVPFPAGEAFDIVDAAVRELPYVDTVESARDSLQVHARVKRMHPYLQRRDAEWEARGRRGMRRNLVHAMVTPGSSTSTLNLVCEPQAAAWLDWYLVDGGTNLDNIEAITRAITRRVSEARKAEEQKVRETATEKELTVAKLSLLHAQVEPHFLYNTLASAQILTRSDPAKADQMLGNLITYLRHSVPRAEESLSTLGGEVERARAYLEILRIRMGERLQVQVQVPDALKPAPLPPMMLQTLVENAIKHGLEVMPGGGTVWLTARESGGKVAVTVADDGAGFNEHTGGTGIGLRNVRERLKLAYGDEASLSIVSNFPRGVAATITVPCAGPSGGARG